MGKNKVKIKINYSLCAQPEECRKCLKICEPAVFNLVFLDKDYHNPKIWRVVPVFCQLCTLCNLCVEICPDNAITLRS
jgi:NADH-quinone oxidoreductase subunit I